MNRLFQIAVLSCAALLLTGCSVSLKSEPIWQNIKIGDLAPSQSKERPEAQLLKTTNFEVFFFEMPAENISALDDVWPILYTKPLKFNDYKAFSANSFSVGFGQNQMWNKVADALRAADGKEVGTVSLLLSDGRADDITIAKLANPKTIFHIPTDGSTQGVTIGPGTVSLRIKAERIPGSRGVCNIKAQPTFSPPVSSTIPRLAARRKSHEFLFVSASFELKMGPGDFIFLGPRRYTSDQITLSSLFFSRAEPSLPAGTFLVASGEDKQKFRPYFGPVVRMFLIVCSRIID